MRTVHSPVFFFSKYYYLNGTHYRRLCVVSMLLITGENKGEMQQALLFALKDGETNSSTLNIYVLGQQNSGKSCLITSLLGGEFEEEIKVQEKDIDVQRIFAAKWSRVKKGAVSETLQKQYYGKLKMAAQKRILAKKQKPFSKVQNRQQLLESLHELPEAVQADLKQATTTSLIDNDDVNAIFWDFADRSLYYGLHSMFLKENNVVLIVFDASQPLQPLQDPLNRRDNQKYPYTQTPITTGCKSVCYWLHSIHSICRKDGSQLGATSIFVPTVLLVATHIDLIGDSKGVEARKREVIDLLISTLKGQQFAKHLAGIENGLRAALEKNCFFVSNKVRNQAEFDRLRCVLVEASQYIVNMQQPIVFLNIEKNLLSLNKTVISTSEFQKIAQESGFFALPESTELKGALAHFHRKGTILHFPMAKSLKDVVVLSPDWLTQLFSHVIVAHPYIIENQYNIQFERLRYYGILEESFIAFMVNKFNKEQEKIALPLSSNQGIEFAQLFDFIVEVNSSTFFLEEDDQPTVSNERVFIVPPMLSLELPDGVEFPDDRSPQVRVVYFRFPERFIQPMVFYQMLSACVDRNIKVEEDLYW